MIDESNSQMLEIHTAIIREAIETGDLKLPVNVDEYQFMFTLFASTIGGCILKESESQIIKDWFEKIKFMYGTFGRIVLDGIGWKPMTNEWDYAESLDRFYREMLPEVKAEKAGFC
jgi:hypothetical protein